LLSSRTRGLVGSRGAGENEANAWLNQRVARPIVEEQALISVLEEQANRAARRRRIRH